MENIKVLRDNFEVIELHDPSDDTQNVLSQADIILAPLGYYLGKEKMDQAPALKIIGSNTTGHPHIDVDYAEKKGIRVITLKKYRDFLKGITPTAELTWGLIIALTRNIIPAYRSVMRGRWARWPFGGERMLSRMSLGIAGLGRLGNIVASYGMNSGMDVRYYDPYVDEEPGGAKKVSTLDELVKTSDIISIHIPHEPETENLFNEKIFSKFKKGSYLINTSRGEVIDQESLLKYLENNHIAGAALDVLDGEFDPGFENKANDHPLVKYARNHSNLIITPHIGGSTKDAWSLTQRFTIDKIIESAKEFYL